MSETLTIDAAPASEANDQLADPLAVAPETNERRDIQDPSWGDMLTGLVGANASLVIEPDWMGGEATVSEAMDSYPWPPNMTPADEMPIYMHVKANIDAAIEKLLNPPEEEEEAHLENDVDQPQEEIAKNTKTDKKDEHKEALEEIPAKEKEQKPRLPMATAAEIQPLVEAPITKEQLIPQPPKTKSVAPVKTEVARTQQAPAPEGVTEMPKMVIDKVAVEPEAQIAGKVVEQPKASEERPLLSVVEATVKEPTVEVSIAQADAIVSERAAAEIVQSVELLAEPVTADFEDRVVLPVTPQPPHNEEQPVILEAANVEVEMVVEEASVAEPYLELEENEVVMLQAEDDSFEFELPTDTAGAIGPTVQSFEVEENDEEESENRAISFDREFMPQELALNIEPAQIIEVEESLVGLVQEIETAEPEVIETVNQIVDKIIEAPLKLETDEGEHVISELEVQTELEELFTELFIAVGINYDPQQIETLAKMCLQPNWIEELKKLKIEDPETPKAKLVDRVIKKFVTVLATLKRAMQHAYAIGSSALQLSQFRLLTSSA